MTDVSSTPASTPARPAAKSSVRTPETETLHAKLVAALQAQGLVPGVNFEEIQINEPRSFQCPYSRGADLQVIVRVLGVEAFDWMDSSNETYLAYHTALRSVLSRKQGWEHVATGSDHQNHPVVCTMNWDRIPKGTSLAERGY